MISVVNLDWIMFNAKISFIVLALEEPSRIWNY